MLPTLLCQETHHFFERPLVETLGNCTASWSLGKEVSSEPHTRPHWAGAGAQGHSLDRARPSLLKGSFWPLVPFQKGFEMLQLKEKRGMVGYEVGPMEVPGHALPRPHLLCL